MTDHTPGPWKAVLADEKATKWYITANIPGMQNSETEIAVVYGGKVDEKSEKNAMLIAAAPDLLAACKALVELYGIRTQEVIGDGLDDVINYDASVLVLAAIAKAEGRA
jgi:hypothetical protein